MDIPVLIERLAKNGFRATCGEPLPLSVEAPTRTEALTKLTNQLESRLTNGAELVTVMIGWSHPWKAFTGIHKANDPLVKEWKAQMAKNRRRIDADPTIP